MNSQPIVTNIRRNTRSSSSERPNINYKETKSRKTTPSNKRKAVNSSPTLLSPEAKKSTSNRMAITVDELKNMLHSHAESIQSNIQQTIKDELRVFGDELKANFEAQIAQINTRIDAMQENTTAQFDAVRADIYSCTEKLKLNEEDTKRIARLNESPGSTNLDLKALHTQMVKI